MRQRMRQGTRLRPSNLMLGCCRSGDSPRAEEARPCSIENLDRRGLGSARPASARLRLAGSVDVSAARPSDGPAGAIGSDKLLYVGVRFAFDFG